MFYLVVSVNTHLAIGICTIIAVCMSTSQLRYVDKLSYNIVMKNYNKLKFELYKLRASWRKRKRLLFPSPAEAEFIRIMGGRRIIIDNIKDPKTGFPLCIVTKKGRILKGESLGREVRVGAMYIDFATVGLVYQKGIEIDGAAFHSDIVKEQDRDDYLKNYGWQILHIKAADVFYNQNSVRSKVANFLAS
jgi:very-short-patch-repair endonuclease